MKRTYRDDRGNRVHPYVPELASLLRAGRIDRREFLRTATLLGVSAAAATAAAGKILNVLPAGSAVAAEAPKAGGLLRCATRVQEMTDPATFDWIEKANIARQVVENLTVTGPDNITRPHLAERWEVDEKLKTWTLHLRPGITWSNGDKFNADDVLFNFTRWLDPAVGSSNIGLFAAMTDSVDSGRKDANGQPVLEMRMRSDAIEKIDDLTVRLHLKQPVLTMPENLYSYPAALVNRRFVDEGGDFSRNPVGTGPFVLESFEVGGQARLRKRPDYWGGAAYIDELHYYDLGEDQSAVMNAFESDQIDTSYQVDVTVIDRVRGMPNVQLHDIVTAQTAVARMQVDQAPFDNPLVRRALAACLDPAAVLAVAHAGFGAIGENHHVAPVHPEYFPLPQRRQDYALARRLLAEAGYADGLEVQLDCGSTSGPWELAAMEVYQQQCIPAGINLKLRVVPAATYWEIWNTTPFGFTAWTHRPLGVMVLNLGYRSGVPWNESHYSNPAFDRALDAAGAILDAGERKKAMEQVQQILQEDAVIVQPLWRSIFGATNKRVRNFSLHPSLYQDFTRVWIDGAA